MDMVKDFNYKTVNTVQGNLSVMSKYMEHALNKELIEINQVKKIISNEDLEQLMNKKANEDRYIRKDELDTIINSCENAQDAVIFALLFEGVHGANFSEIANLKKEDINFNTNIIRINRFVKKIDENGYTRKIEKNIDFRISNRTLKLITEAVDEEYYRCFIGSGTSEEKYGCKTLKYGACVVRQTGNGISTPVNRFIITRRVKNVVNNNGRPNITPQTIYLSGAVYYVNTLLLNNKEQSIKDEPSKKMYEETCIKFNVNPKTSWYRLKKLWFQIYSSK
jgi:integrase